MSSPILTNINTAVLVYDFVTAQRVQSPLDESARLGWTPLDTGSALSVCEWFKLSLNGEERLFFLSNDGFVNLYEEREDGDEVVDDTRDNGIGLESIAMRARTRGYFGETMRAFQRPVAATVSLNTWNPTYSVTAVFEGVNKTVALATDETRDRTKYFRPFNAPRYDATNTNGDFSEPYREDYSVVMGTDGVVFDTAGINLGTFTSVTESQNINARQGRFIQLEVTNSTGRLQLAGVKLEAVPNAVRRGKHV